MKNFILLIAIFSSSYLANAQTAVQDVAGTYQRHLVNNDQHTIIYTLNLNPDGTFQLHSYSKIDLGPPGKTVFRNGILTVRALGHWIKK